MDPPVSQSVQWIKLESPDESQLVFIEAILNLPVTKFEGCTLSVLPTT
jgi:hypothetical protein